MPKKQAEEPTDKSQELNFTIGNISDIPKVIRAGRTSRYAPLYERVKTLGNDEMISLPIKKYSQVQAFRGRLLELGFVVSVRKEGKNLTAFVKHKQEEKS